MQASAASPSGLSSDLYAQKVKMAKSLHMAFQTLAAKAKLNDQVAKQANYILANTLLEYAKTELKNYSFAEWNNLPYEISFVENRLGLTHAFLKGNKNISFIALIFNRTFSLYFRNRIDSETYEMFELPSLKNISADKLPNYTSNSELADGYIIFLSHRNIRMLPPPTPADSEGQQYYYYRAPQQEPINLSEAAARVKLPFHHEVQIDGHCGLHALNAFLGNRYFTAEHLRELEALRKSMGDPVSDTEWSAISNTDAKSNNKSSTESSREPSPKSSREPSPDSRTESSHDCANLNGLDTGFLRYVLDQMAGRPGGHQIIALGSQTNAAQRRNLIDHFKRIDRFILGITKDSCAHALAFRKEFRKDAAGKRLCEQWWRIDSKKNWQDSFTDEEELFEVIREDCANHHLAFIIPTDNLTYKSPRKEVK